MMDGKSVLYSRSGAVFARLLIVPFFAAPFVMQPLMAQNAEANAAAQGSTGQGSAGQGDVAVTIYNNNLALVQDIRQVNLPAGTTRQEFPDVSASIRPETVSLTGADFGIAEQNFDYDLLSPEKLMEKAVGQTVTLLRTNTATGAETRERAKILAANGGVVIQVGDRIEVLRDDGLPVRVIFDKVPSNLRAKPTLSVTVDSARAGTRPLTLSYLTGGLGWRADYVSLFDEKAGTINMQGWITLTNNTGTTFNNAETLLVAGEVGQIQQSSRRSQFDGRPGKPQGNQFGTESGSREQLGDFYLYPIKGSTTIANAQTKQVSFLDVIGAKATKAYEYRNEWLGTADSAQSAATVLKFSNARDGGIGDAMPAGTVRVYMKDARGQAQFIGENEIGHTPGGSKLGLKTGEAFDVKIQPFTEKREVIKSDEWEASVRYRITKASGQETVTIERQKEYWRTTMKYVVTNAKSSPVTVDLIQAGLNRYYYQADDRVVSETIVGEQITPNERLWKVPVPANGETTVTVVFDTRY
jgi:hypothetical protein